MCVLLANGATRWVGLLTTFSLLTPGWGSTYATAPWVLVMALPFVSFLFTVVLRSSLASLALSSILSFLLFMRIYATQVQFIAKIAKCVSFYILLLIHACSLLLCWRWCAFMCVSCVRWCVRVR